MAIMQFIALHNRDYVTYIHVMQTGGSNRPELNPKGTIMNIRKSYNEWRAYRTTVNELSRMSDRELSDLGISRGDIAFVSRRAAR